MEKCGRVRLATRGSIVRHMRLSCLVIKATDTQSECVTFVAFPLQQWLGERSSVLRLFSVSFEILKRKPLVCACRTVHNGQLSQ